METDYLIVGGGIAGLSAAIALKKCHKEFVLAEASAELKAVGAGITLAANAMEALAELGAEEQVKSAGKVLHTAAIQDQQGHTLSRVDLRKMSKSRYNLGIHRAALHAALYKELGEQHVLWDKRSESINYKMGRYHIGFQDGSVLSAKHLIVAEGIHSKLREHFLPDSRTRYAGYTCWRGMAHCKADSSLGHEAVEIWGNRGRFGYVQVSDKQIYWFATAKFPQNSAEASKYSLDDLKKRYRDYPERVVELLNQSTGHALLWNDILDLKPIPKYAFGKAVLIGDAAHATTPNLGQGACQAIEDALELYRCLQLPIYAEAQFEEFEKRRKKRSQLIVQRSWSVGKLAEATSPIAVAMRNGLIKRLPEKVNLRQMEQILNQPRF